MEFALGVWLLEFRVGCFAGMVFFQLMVIWCGFVVSAGENEESVSMELTTFRDSAVGFENDGVGRF